MAAQLSILNPSPKRLNGPSLLHNLVQPSSERIAIEYHENGKESIRITYQELHDRADHLASQIRTRLGDLRRIPTPNVIVPLLLHQYADLYIAQLAVLKAGAAFCPLPLDAPEDRLRFILQDVDARLVLTNTSLQSKVPVVDGVDTLDIEQAQDNGGTNYGNWIRDPTADRLAYVMYTSGSTGLPKGVLLSHSSVTQALLAHDRHIPQYSRFLQVAAPTFDVSVFEIFFTFFRGQTLVCCNRTQLLSDLPGTINNLSIDAAELTPSVASNLLGPRDEVPGLKVLLTIGEMLKKDVVERFGGSNNQPSVLHGMYGPTEAAIHCTLQPDFLVDMAVNNIGVPLATVSAFVLPPASEDASTEAALSVLPYGDEGELVVGGHQLADGYLNRDEQTRAVFIQHPVYGKLYRTGDKARFVDGGKIECLGRISGGQVKLRGQRLELGEVEYAVSKTSSCTGAVAEVISSSLVVFCRCDTDQVGEDDVRATCKRWLPAYMMPSHIVFRSDLPYLASGKIDRQKLRSEFEASQPTAAEADLPAGSELEQKVLEAVQNVLGAQAVHGPDLQLTNLDSLSSIRLASALGKVGNFQPMATLVMQARTVGDLVDLLQDGSSMRTQAAKEVSDLLIKQRLEQAILDPLLSSRREDIEDILPCSAVQSAMLAESAIDAQRYCNWLEFEVDERYTVHDVKPALENLIKKHSLLRSGFVNVSGASGGFTLVIWNPDSHNWIQDVTQFDRQFRLDDCHELLHACRLQVKDGTTPVRFLLQIHHSLYDQWSIDVFERDFENVLAGRELQTKPFADIIKSYAGSLDSALSDESLSFWKSQVANLESLTLPNLSSVKAPANQNRTSWRSFNIPSAALMERAREQSRSPQSFLQSAYAVLLRLIHGTNDVCYGTVFSGRHIPVTGIDGIFGPCLTTLPVHLRQGELLTWNDLLRAVHNKNREILRFSSTPLSQIKRLSPSSSRENLFETLFLWQESTITSAGPRYIREVSSADYHEFKLVLECRASQEFVEARVTYDAAYIPAQHAELILLQIQEMLKSMLERPEGYITSLEQDLSPQLMSISNPEPLADAEGVDLVAALEEAGRQNSNLDAVCFASAIAADTFDTQTISYGALHARANQLARRLLEVGVVEDDLVCICMEKSIDFYTAILAVVKTGAGYLPLAPEVKTERAITIMRQATVRAVLTGSSGHQHFTSMDVPVLQPSHWQLDDYPSNSLEIVPDGDSAAYAVFTSGSTGVPKGVVVTRNNLLGNIITLQHLYKAKAGGRLLQACSQGFDVAVFEIFFSLYTGMTICTAKHEVLFNDLERSIRSLQATHLSMTPSVAALVQPQNVPSVHFLVTAGEAMTAAVHSAWAGKGLHQGYGPSETTNICSVNLDVSPEHHHGSIGPPFRNTSAFVIDASESRTILPKGAFGEFAFGGEQVFRGYLGLDELNKQKIWDHPQYGRLYRSGDLGRILADGTLLIQGRSDFQVKIRGNRIELGEISSQIQRQPIVSDCVTIVGASASNEASLFSFWTAGDGFGNSCVVQLSKNTLSANADIHQALANYLPSYMLPTLLIPVSRLPRTEQGKMDHRALRKMIDNLTTDQRVRLASQPNSASESIPVHPDEEVIATTVAEVLNVSGLTIDRHSPLDAFGLTSISAVYLAKALQTKLKRSIPVGGILRHNTIARLANATGPSINITVEADQDLCVFDSSFIKSVRSRFAESEYEVEDILPCTPLQEAMLSASAGETAAYYNSSTFLIKGDLKRLKHCFERACRRHAILRTAFVQSDQADRPYAQVILRNITLPWIEVSLKQERNDGVSNISHMQPISLQIFHSGDATELTIHMHHATYDATSMAVLLEEVEAMYNSQQLQPAPSTVPFLRLCLQQTGSEAQQFWSGRLHGFLPQPFPTHNQTSFNEQHITFTITAAYTNIQAYSRVHSASFSAVLQASWARCLSMLQGVDDVCFGNVVNGRMVDIAGIDSLLLPCFNTIPIRVDISQHVTKEDLVKHLSRAQQRESVYQLTPLRLMQRLSKKPSNRLFDSLLLLQGPARQVDQHIWQPLSEQGEMGFPIVLELTPSGGDLSLQLHYQLRYLNPNKAREVAKLFIGVLNSIVDESKAHTSKDLDHGLNGILQSESSKSSTDKQLRDDDTEWTDEENDIAEVLCMLAKIDRAKIRKSSSIYELGLDSLNAAQIAAQLRQRGYMVDLADIMEHRTPYGIASSMLSRSTDATKAIKSFDLSDFDKQHRHAVLQKTSLSDKAVESVRPCTAVQLGMLSQSIAHEGGLYVNHVHFGIPAGTTSTSLQTTLISVQKRHPLLRTLFVSIEVPNLSHIMVTLNEHAAKLPAQFEDCSPEHDHSLASSIINSQCDPMWRTRLTRTAQGLELILVLHHALFDATSLEVLRSDIATALYGGLLGPAYALDSLLLDNIAASSNDNSAPSFWKAALDASEFVPFPILTACNVKDNTAKSCSHTCDMTRATVEALCVARHCTVQAAGQATWAYVLCSYLGESNVLFGTVLSTRQPDQASQIFPSLNTLPIAVRAAQPAELLADMVDYNSRLQRHRLTPLSDIQRYAGRPGQALFDTVFVFQAVQHNYAGQTLSITRQSSAVDFKVSIELEYTETDDILLTLSYSASVLDHSHAKVLLAQFETVFINLLNARTDLIEPNDSRLLSITPPAHRSLPSPVTLLHDFVSLSAEQFPETCAIEFINSLEVGDKSRQTWTYSELESFSNELAHLIQKNGARSGDVVAVCMDKCPEASMCFPAILKTGCAFLAMDPELPKARKEFILKDSGAVLLLVESTTKIGDLETMTKILPVSLARLQQRAGGGFEPVAVDPQSTCYCLYTSGTTGTPKGCEITHENAVQAMMSFQHLFAGHWTPSSRWLQFASYWFDVSILEHFWSWSVGITMVGAPRDIVLGDLVHFINEANITHIDLTPSLARLLEPSEVPSLCNGVFITGGEALKQEIIQKWGQYNVICNGYGPTEATIGVTMNRFISSNARPANIGPPFANVGAYVLDPGTEAPVLRGAIGELCVSGKLVGKGYLNRPDLTANAFPEVKALDERLYRTGDLVRQLADGSLLFVGRKDSQAKLRGQRLELDEIDEVIKSACPKMNHVVSLVIKSDDSDKQLLISFVAKQSRTQSEVHLVAEQSAQDVLNNALDACRRQLPGYMVPTYILPLLCIPLTVNNKVDIKSLESFYQTIPAQTLRGLGGNEEQSLDKNGKKIAALIAEMLSLDVDEINGNSNLFALGLSSVSVVPFVQKLRKCGFSRANIASTMRTPQLNQLSELLTRSGEQRTSTDQSTQQARLRIAACDNKHRRTAALALKMSIDDIEAVVPCTALQSGLLVESLQKEHRPYFNTFSYRHSTLDLQKLRNALETVVDNVQVLRTKFVQTEDGFVQAIMRNMQLSFANSQSEEKDLPKHLCDAKDRWISINSNQVYQPFAVLATTCESCVVITLHLHHAIYDGISLGLLIDALALSYQGTSTIDTGPAFTESLIYGPLRNNAASKQFWIDATKNLAFNPLGGYLQPSTESTTVSWSFRTSSALLDNTRRAIGVSYQAIVQCAFQTAFRKMFPRCGSFGTVVSGRSIELQNAEKTIGPLFNTLPVAINIGKEESWNDSVLRCQAYNTALVEHQFTPLRDIKKWCGYGADEDLFDALFVFQVERDKPENVPSFGCAIDGDIVADYALAFEATLTREGRLDAILVAQDQIVNLEALKTLAQHVLSAFDEISQHRHNHIVKSFGADIVTISPSRSTKLNYDHLNGIHNFAWNDKARLIKEQLVELAEVDSDEVDEHSSLFGLGLDSIDAVRLASRLKKRELDLPVSALIKAQTIPRMIQACQSQQKDEVTGSAMFEALSERLQASIMALGDCNMSHIDCILPATPSQEGLLTLMQASEFTNYFNHDLLQLDPSTDMARLQEAWQTVTHEHAILRTSFVQVEDLDIDCVFAQLVHRPAKLHIPEIRLGQRSDLEILMGDIRASVANTIKSTPPFRLTSILLAEQRYLLLSISHALYDGHCLSLLHDDVQRAYNDLSISRPNYDRFIDGALRATSNESLRFWQEYLYGAKECRLQRRNATGQDGINREEKTSDITQSDARTFCRTHSISMQSLGQTCWSLILAHYTQSSEVLFGTVLACRDSEELEQLMFPTMNTMALRATLHGNRKDMLRSIQATALEISPFKQTPLRRIQTGSVQPNDRRPAHTLFNTLFIYQQRPQAVNNDKPLYHSQSSSSSIDYPIAIEMEATDRSIVLRVAADNKFLSSSDTREVLEDFDHVLRSIIKSPLESCLDFHGESISICGLPAFTIGPRQTLDDKSTSSPESAINNIDTASKTYRILVDVLAKVSGTSAEDIRPEMSLIDIGLDSVSTIKVASMLRKREVSTTVSSLIKAGSISTINITQTSEKNRRQTSSEVFHAYEQSLRSTMNRIFSEEDLLRTGFSPNDISMIIPATSGQLYMLAAWRMSHGRLFYPTFQYQVVSEMSKESLRTAWQHLVDHHDILRTIFWSTGSRDIPVAQIVLKSCLSSVHFGPSWPDTATSQPLINLRAEPHGTGWRLFLRIHHALYDAVSLSLIVKDLATLVEGQTLPRNSTTFKRYLAETIGSDQRLLRRTFWTDYLDGVSQIQLMPTTAETANTKAEVYRPAFIHGIHKLENTARSQQLSVQSILFAIWAKLYFRLAQKAAPSSSASDVVLGVYLLNRGHFDDMLALRAPTINLVPLLVRDADCKPILEVAKNIQRDLRSIGELSNSAVALWEISEWTNIHIDSFVNFLRLPENEEGNQDEPKEVAIETCNAAEETSRSKVVTIERQDNFELPRGLQAMPVWRNAYKDSLDIELRIAEDDLDVGIFGLESLASLQGIESMFRCLSQEVQEFTA